MKPALPVVALSAALAMAVAGTGVPGAAQTAPPAPAQPAVPSEPTPESLLRAGIENLLRALGLALQNLPQYEMPQINEYGDIIIRRVNPTKPRPGSSPQSDEPRRL